jgi:hypothetical protein
MAGTLRADDCGAETQRRGLVLRGRAVRGLALLRFLVLSVAVFITLVEVEEAPDY